MSTTNILDLNNRIDALEKKQDQDTTDYEQLSHLPKINSVELKGNKTTSDLLISYTDITDKPTIPTSASGITYDNTVSGLTATDVQGAVDELRQADNIMMSDNVTSVEDAIAGNHGAQTPIDITTYNSANNYYICPSNGWAVIVGYSGSRMVIILDDESNWYSVLGTTANDQSLSIYVPKGTKIAAWGSAQGTSISLFRFIPIT